MSEHVDKVAEAICESTGSGQMFPWSTLSEGERDAWRRMAKAAIDALGLTDERAIDHARIVETPLMAAGGIDIRIEGRGQGYAECGLCKERLDGCYADLCQWADSHAKTVHDATDPPQKTRLVGPWVTESVET